MRQKYDFLVQSSGSAARVDVLAEVLRGVRLRSRVHARYEMTAPWGMRMDRAPYPVFYAVMRGSCLLSSEGVDHTLAEGDFLFIPAGRRFALRDRRSTRAVPIAEVYATRGLRCGGLLQYGGGGAAATLVVGSFAFEGETASPLVQHLPDVLHVRAEDPGAPRRLESTLQFLAAEIEAKQPGYETVVSRLADVLFVQALRAHMSAQSAAETGWLRALVDPRLGAALRSVHEAPERRWTLEILARIAGMSRSVFAEKFRTFVGEAPLTYVARWRMHRAMERMRDRDASLAQIARDVGYETESAFGKAFKRHLGVTPGVWRRRTDGRDDAL